MPTKMPFPSCPNPSYTRVLGSDVVANLVAVGVGLGGLGAGYAVGRAAGHPAAGALIGGGLGFVGGIYPAVLAQRAVLRSPECPAPSRTRIFGYRVAQGVLTGLAAAGARAAFPDKCLVTTPAPAASGPLVGAFADARCQRNITRDLVMSAAAVFATPLLGKAMIKGN